MNEGPVRQRRGQQADIFKTISQLNLQTVQKRQSFLIDFRVFHDQSIMLQSGSLLREKQLIRNI